MSLAAGAGRTDICELLLANGADVNAHNSVGCKASPRWSIHIYLIALLIYIDNLCVII